MSGRQKFAERLGHSFRRPELLSAALTHSSCQKGNGPYGFDRLEYLGDAVLELTVSEYLFKSFPEYPEGLLTKTRARIVSEDSLYRAAKRMGLDAELSLGKGEELSGGRDKPSILSDAFEALAGAVFLDAGYEAASDFVLRHIRESINDVLVGDDFADFKTMLQETLQAISHEPIEYATVEETHEGEQIFRSKVSFAGKVLGEGMGKRKKLAEQDCAKNALPAARELAKDRKQEFSGK